MIFIIALGLIFYAATTNFSSMSFSKTSTIRAANTMAAQMASSFASLGHSLSEQYLRGGFRICKDAVSWFDIIVWSALVIISVSFYGSILPYLLTDIVGTSVLVALIEYQPSYQRLFVVPQAAADMWNRMIADMSTPGQVIEGGLQTGLAQTVTDISNVPDFFDQDRDGVYGMSAGVPNDTIPRFVHYYTRRLQGITVPNKAAVTAFVDALDEMWNRGDDNWALMDPLVCSAGSTHPCCRTDRFNPVTGQARLDFPAECDPCCQEQVVDGVSVRPECCDYAPGVDVDGDGNPDKCGDPASCTVRSLYYADDESSPNNYPYVYKPFSYENSLNSFLSFRERLGRDDEHHRYHVRQSEPNSHLVIDAGRQLFSAPLPADNIFSLEDATGYYRAGVNTAGVSFFTNPPQIQDRMKGIFPFFYKAQSPGWGVELNTLAYTNDQCHWCDRLGDGTPQGGDSTCSGPPTPYLPQEIPRLNLGVTTLGTFSGGWCVDRFNTGGPLALPLVFDRVAALPAGLFAAPGDCAQTTGGWKSGADRFCSSSFPYEQSCAKHGAGCTDAGGNAVDCECGEAGAGAAAPDITTGYMGWPDDITDDIIYGLPTFLSTSSALMNGNIVLLKRSFTDWYPGIAEWIEPGCPANAGDPCNDANTSTTAPQCPEPGDGSCNRSYTNLAREGILWTWRNNLQSFYDLVFDWVFPPAGSEYEGISCTVSPPGNPDDVWCIPPSLGAPNNYGVNECAYVQPVEAATFDVNGNGIRGDLEDVVACLNWNANDTRTYVGGAPPATGNAEKFQRCGDAATCSSETCSQLPRCLVPAFYAPWPPFVDPTDPIYPLFVACRDSATVDLCSANCSQPAPLPSGPPYNLPPWFPPALAQIAAFDATVADFFANTCTIDPFAIITICDADNAGGTDLNCGSTAGEVAACRCSWYNSCAGFPSPAGCGGDATYYNAVATAASALGGACAQTGPGQFIDVVRQCEAEARIQVAKMRKRYNFLNNRLQEAMDMINPALDASGNPVGILSGAVARLTAFLDNGTPWGTAGTPNPPNTQDSPSETLIDARINNQAVGDLASVVVYVWREDILKKPRADGSYTGYWHAIKIEARIVGRCNNACGVGGVGDPPSWPTIRSYLKGKWYNRKICYEMQHTDGMVKARVIRYDEDRDPQNASFPGGEKIWETRSYHPALGEGAFFSLDPECRDFVDPDLEALGEPYANAFMLNSGPTEDDVGFYTDYFQCWRRVHVGMLQYGVSTEACAQYTWGGVSPGVGRAGMRVKFTPCDAGFLSGVN